MLQFKIKIKKNKINVVPALKEHTQLPEEPFFLSLSYRTKKLVKALHYSPSPTHMHFCRNI